MEINLSTDALINKNFYSFGTNKKSADRQIIIAAHSKKL
jgi:hypothetical protein